MNRVYFTGLLLSGVIFAHAQNKVTGTIVNAEDGQPVIGASVIVKGTKVGTVTDSNGHFSLSVKDGNKVLQVSYIGMVPQEVAAKDLLKVSLQPRAKSLNEVVVTALGISRSRKSLGYADQVITSDALKNAKESNFVNSLSGKIAGLKVTNTGGDMGSAKIILRGETSISGDNQPLFIIDGVPVDNSVHNGNDSSRDFKNALADLSSEDIASISVLKGPNAAALYGSRAAHGVVLITTKSGKGQKGFGVDFYASAMFTKVAVLPTWQNEFGEGSDLSFDYVDGKGSGVKDDVDESWGPRLDTGLKIRQFDSPVINGVRQATPWVSHPNNVRDFFRTGSTYSAGLALSKADDRFNYRLSYNYEKQQGVVPYSESKKNNFSLTGDYHISKNLSAGASINYIINDIPNYPGGSYGARAAGVMLPFLWFGRQVDMESMRNDWSLAFQPKWYSNPFWRAANNVNSQTRNRLIGNVHFDYDILPELKFTFRASRDYYADEREYRVHIGTAGTPAGKYTIDNYKFSENNYDAMLHYVKQLNKDFSLDALLGWNRRDQILKNVFNQSSSLSVDGIFNLQSSASALTGSNKLSQLRTYSLYGSFQLGYKDFAYLNVTGRNDWSSTLPLDNNSYFYPSFNTSLILSQLLGIQSKSVNYIKVRGGWSQVGNDTDPYQLKNSFVSQTAFNGNASMTSNTNGKNDQLKPEITNSTEVGIEAAFFDNRLHVDASYYHTVSKNQILSVETSEASGFATQLLNAGKIVNRGFELQLSGTPVRTKDFSWDANLNFSTNKSKVEELDKDGLITSYTMYSSGVQVVAEVGNSFGVLKGTTYTRDEKGNIVVDSNGLPVVNNTISDLGKYAPSWTGGLTNTFTYKNLTFSFLIDCSFGGKLYSGTETTGTYTGVLASTLPGRAKEFGGLEWTDKNGKKRDDGILVKGVTTDGKENTTIVSAESYYHRLYSINENFVHSSEYVKLREVSLSYKFPQWKWLSKLYVKGATLSLVGRNLWIIHKKTDIDPETSLNGNLGIETLALPSTRSFGITLNVKF